MDTVNSSGHETAVVAFAPVISLRNGGVIAYRGVVREPLDPALEGTPPESGTALAPTEPLDHLGLQAVGRAFSEAKLNSKLLVNINPRLVRRTRLERTRIDQLVRELDLSPTQLILEVTRPRGTVEAKALYRVLPELRALGFEIAIDDFKEGEASLVSWSDLQPDYVRLAGEPVRDLHLDAAKFQFVRLVRQLAQNVGSQVLASDVTQVSELRLLRDLGIDLAEGPLICPARPITEARVTPGLGATMGWAHRRNSGESLFSNASRVLLRSIARPIASALPQTTLGALEKRFAAQAGLEAVAVVHEGAVHGYIRREVLAARVARRDWERWRERRADEFMEAAPLVIDGQLTLQDASVLLAQGESTHFGNPIIVTERGRYLGVSSAQQLMRELTQFQFQANRHANPLTGLPGDVPIHEGLQGLLDQRLGFTACSADISHLKAYNEVFGYGRGDNLIKYAAILLQAYCDERLDFFGHRSGGQFILLMRRTDWQDRLQAVITQFAVGRHAFLEPEDIERGGYYCHDRRGTPVFHALPDLSIGVVQVEPGIYTTYHQVLEAITLAAAEAKKMSGSAIFIERRRLNHNAPP